MSILPFHCPPLSVDLQNGEEFLFILSLVVQISWQTQYPFQTPSLLTFSIKSKEKITHMIPPPVSQSDDVTWQGDGEENSEGRLPSFSCQRKRQNHVRKEISTFCSHPSFSLCALVRHLTAVLWPRGWKSYVKKWRDRKGAACWVPRAAGSCSLRDIHPSL